MKQLLFLAALLGAATSALSQDSSVTIQNALPAVQPSSSSSRSKPWNSDRIFFGGIYGINTNGTPHVGAFGFTTSFSHDFKEHFGLEVEYARLFGRNDYISTLTWSPGLVGTPQGGVTLGTFVNNSTPMVTRHNAWLAGPRNAYKSAFFHVLFGIREDTVNAHNVPTTSDSGQTVYESLSSSASAFTIDVGGGYDLKMTRHLALRTSFDYIPSFKNGYALHVVAASIGPVFSFGNRSISSADLGTDATRHGRPSVPVPSLGLLVTTREENDGAEVVETTSGGAAEAAYLRSGDVINAVDGRPVKSPMELLAELSNKPSGSTVRLAYMFRSSSLGYFQKEITVELNRSH